MNSTLFLRIASIVSLLFAAGHTLGGDAVLVPRQGKPKCCGR